MIFLILVILGPAHCSRRPVPRTSTPRATYPRTTRPRPGTWPIQDIVLWLGLCARINTIICAPTICLSTPPHTDTARTIAQYNVTTDPRYCNIHHTILAIVKSCKGQPGTPAAISPCPPLPRKCATGSIFQYTTVPLLWFSHAHLACCPGFFLFAPLVVCLRCLHRASR